MKKLLFAWFLVSSLLTLAQSTDYNKIILPDQITNATFEEKLIQIAWKNHPSNKIIQSNVSILKKQKKLADLAWLDNIYGVGNLNEFTLHPNDPTISNNRAQFYPRYNFGIRLSIGTFVLTPIQSRIARDQISSGELEVNQKKLEVRRNVLTAIELLKQDYKILKIRTRAKEDFLVLYKDAEQKFSSGQIKIDQYRLASQDYLQRSEAEIIANSNFRQRKFDMEALLGLSLDDIEEYALFLKDLDTELRID